MYREKCIGKKKENGGKDGKIGGKIRKIDLFVDFFNMEWKEIENGNGREMGRE